MAQLDRLWAGRVYGTNTGNVFIELTEREDKLLGTLKLVDDRWGAAEFKIEGTFADRVILKGEPIKSEKGVAVGNLHVEGNLTSEGHIRGTWNSDLGTAGTFELFPHDATTGAVRQGARAAQNSSSSDTPEQIYSKTILVGAVRVYGDDLKQLLQHMKKDFASARPIVTYNARGSQVTKYAEDFLSEGAALGNIEYLKIQIQELEAHGINKLIVVELDGSGVNEVRAQGIRESWVVGSAETLAVYLKKHERKLATTFRPFGFNFNLIVLCMLLIVLPSIASAAERATLVVLSQLALVGLYKVHQHFIPNARVNLASGGLDVVDRIVVSTISWGLAFLSVLVTKLLYSWLTPWLNLSP